VARALALAAVIAVGLLAVSGAGGAGAQRPRVGGTVVVGNLAEPACLNVLLAACTSEASRYIAELILLPAFDVSPRYTYRPRLVSRVTKTKTPPFTLTYHIRPAARWSDGVQITARDFLFTHRARMATRAELSEAERQDLRRVRSVSRVDAKTVRVVLRARYSGWRAALFGNVLPAHALAGRDPTTIWKADRIDDPKTGRSIGSGPFLLASWDRGRELTLVRNPHYWGAHRAYLDRIVIRFRTESEDWVDLFRHGEVDMAYGIFADAVVVLRRAGVKVLAEPSAGYQAFFFRTGPTGGHPALRGKQGKPVRRALAYAIDRAALVSKVPGEVDRDLRPLQSLLFLAQSPYYRPHWSSYRYRPALARRMLVQAGCLQGADGIYSCDGERLSLRFLTRVGNPGRARLLALVQAQLRGSGVEVVPEFAGPGGFETKLLSGAFDVALFGFFNTPNPTGNSIFGCGGSANYTGYCQRLVTKDLDQADRILDTRQQARVMNRADAQMARDMPALPLFQIPLATAVRDNIMNFAQSLNPLTNSENWWLER
jgi:peptide/nickel transport system substrate-binding protein